MASTARRNRYLVTLSVNGREVKMIARAYDRLLAEDVSVLKAKEDTGADADVKVLESMWISGPGMRGGH